MAIEERVALHEIQTRVEESERVGVYVRCPLSGRAFDIGECLFCAHYRGLQMKAGEPARLRCAAPLIRSRASWSLEPAA
jgi:hypothetical protein